jgi:23S rRNA pseudouridine2605 synthase
VDGEPVRPAEKTYVLFHKPRGVVAEFEAPGKETLLSFLKELGPRVFAVDPLPEDAAGALFLTNDGALVNDLNQPGCHVERVYLASVEGRASEGVLERLAAGVRVDEESVTRVQAVVLDQRMRTALLRIRLRETGSVRVSRVLDAVGLPVYELRRVEYGGLHLGDLEPGQWRPLAKEEMQSLYREMRL